MKPKTILEYIYPVNEYMKLKDENPFGFLLTIVIPLLLLFSFLYLYFYPFGYNKEITLTNEDILNGEKGSVSFQENTEETKGLVNLTFDPKLPIRNPYVTVSIKGENISLLPDNVDLSEMLDIWDYSTTSFKKESIQNTNELEEDEFENYTYTSLDNYSIKDSQILSFYLKWEPEKDDDFLPNDIQLLLKYGNIRIIQNIYSIELRVDEVYDGQIYTYQRYAFVNNSFYNNTHELVAVYAKPDGKNNGYIELVVDGNRTGRQIVVSPYNLFYDYDDLRKYGDPINDQLEKDLTQEKISLGQELYRVELEKEIPNDLRSAVDIYSYYADKYKPDLDSEMTLSLSDFYNKTFYNYFKGNIYELRVGFQYPFENITTLSGLYPTTPFSVSIVGNVEDIEEINLQIQRDPIWKKLMNF